MWIGWENCKKQFVEVQYSNKRKTKATDQSANKTIVQQLWCKEYGSNFKGHSRK